MAVTGSRNDQPDDEATAILSDVDPISFAVPPMSSLVNKCLKPFDRTTEFNAEFLTATLHFLVTMKDCRVLQTNHFRGRIAQHLLGAGVKDCDQAINVTGNNGNMGRSLHNCLHPRSRKQQFFASIYLIRRVHDVAVPSHGSVFLTTGSRVAEAPTNGTVRKSNTVFMTPPRKIIRRTLNRFNNCRIVIRMQNVEYFCSIMPNLFR